MKIRLLFLLLVTIGFAKAQDNKGPYINFSAKNGLNLLARDSTASLKIGLRVQPLLVVNYRDFEVFTDPNLDEVAFVIRRARLKFDGFFYNKKWVYKVELAMGNRNIGGATPYTSNGARLVLDAVIKYQFAKNYFLWFGQTKLPGNRERVVSSGKLEFVDRSIANGRFNIDRDLGLQLHSKHKIGNMPLNAALAVSMGEGRNISVTNLGGLDFTAHVDFLPLGNFTNKGDYSLADLEREQRHKIAIGLTYDNNHNAVRERGNQGSYMFNDDNTLYTQTVQSFFLDAIWKYRGWSSLVEYFYKTAPNPILLDTLGNIKNAFYVGTGFNAQLGYVFKNNWQIAARYSNVRPEANVDLSFGNQDQYTLGFSKYILGHKLKFQGDVSYSVYELIPEGEFQYRLQFEFAL